MASVTVEPAARTHYYDWLSKRDIPIYALFWELMQTAHFKRLWLVKQMAFAFLATLNTRKARHTRGEHSRGTLEMAQRVIEQLHRTGGLDGISKEDLLDLLIAALLHDIGHYPYSHSMEEVPGLVSHEINGYRIITTDPQIVALLKKYGRNPVRIANLIEPPRDGYRSAVDQLLHNLLSGELIDFDRLEYTRRDGVLLGVPRSEWFRPRKMINSLHVHESKLVITQDGVEGLTRMMALRRKIRTFSYEELSCSAEAMLQRAVSDALMRGALMAEELSIQGDRGLLEKLTGRDMPDSTHTLAEGLMLAEGWLPATSTQRFTREPGDSKIYLPAISIGPKDDLFHLLEPLQGDGAAQQRVALSLADLLGVEGHQLLLSVPLPVLKGNPDMSVLGENGKLRPFSSLVPRQAYDGPDIRRFRLYTPPEKVEELGGRDLRGAIHEVLAA